MNRNRMSVYLPVLSLLLFLVLSFLRCSGTGNNPVAPAAGEEEGQLTETATDGEFSLTDMVLVRTKPGERLDRSDVQILYRRWNTSAQNLWVDIPDPGVFLFDFGPHGKKFRIPLRIDISLDKADIESFQKREIKVWYLNERGSERVPCMVNAREGTVSFWVKHFSRYALSRE